MFLKRILVIASAMLALTAAAINNPPYEFYGYLADATDDPPVNYMKVVEPGRTGEANASYVVLGISFPRTYQAVAGNYDKDLVIPAYIDGLPVRRINEAAFIECNLIKSVKIPATVREIGARAFVAAGLGLRDGDHRDQGRGGGSDFASSLLKPTGKKGAGGEALVVWQDYVAGTDPTKQDDVFTAKIKIVDNTPVVSYSPVLSEAEAARRKYTVYGRASLYGGDWSVVAPGTAANYNFFKVAVEMR